VGQVEAQLLVDQPGMAVDVVGREAQQHRAQALDHVLAAQVGHEGLGVGVDPGPVDLDQHQVALGAPGEVHTRRGRAGWGPQPFGATAGPRRASDAVDI